MRIYINDVNKHDLMYIILPYIIKNPTNFNKETR